MFRRPIMATTRISYSLPPNIDVTQAPLAFGVRALPKLNQELRSVELIVRQRALIALSNLVHDPEKVYRAIAVGCIESLKLLLSDKDSTVRHKATEVLYIAATHNIGRNAFLEYGVIAPLAALFDDEVEIVRENAHKAIGMLSEIPSGATGVVNGGLIPQLVRKLSSEVDPVKCTILNTLHFCARVDPITCLNAGIMTILTTLLQHTDHHVQSGSARVMMDVTVPLEGKKQACKSEEVVPLLVMLLRDLNDEVKANAAGALMMIAITTDGKYTILRANAISELLLLVNCNHSEARLNATKALTMLAEAPEGREALLSHVGQIEDRTMDPRSKAVCEAAKIALKVIEWKP